MFIKDWSHSIFANVCSVSWLLVYRWSEILTSIASSRWHKRPFRQSEPRLPREGPIERRSESSSRFDTQESSGCPQMSSPEDRVCMTATETES